MSHPPAAEPAPPRPPMLLPRGRAALTLVAIVAVAGVSSGLNLPFGPGEDFDAHLVLTHAEAFAADGYRQSRTWGFPAYEGVIYPLVSHLGLTVGKVYSLLWFLLAVGLFFGLARSQSERLGPASLATLGFALLPVSLISGNTLLETSQGMCLALVGLGGYVHFAASRRPASLLVMAGALGLATATRPDYVVLAAAVSVALLWRDRPPWRPAFGALAVYLLTALLPFLLYPQQTFGLGVVIPDPFSRKVTKAGLGLIGLFGLPGVLWLGVESTRLAVNARARARLRGQGGFLVLVVAAWGLYLIRYLWLPDELEYVYVLVPLTLLLVLRLEVPAWRVAVLAAALALPGVVQLHLFDRDARGRLVTRVGLSPGALAQNRSQRQKFDYLRRELPALEARVARRYGFRHHHRDPVAQPGHLVIIPADRLRFYDRNRFGGKYHRVRRRTTLVTHPISSHRGWRQLLRHRPWRRLREADFRLVHRAR